MTRAKRKPTCSHGTEHWTPSGHCRVCDNKRRSSYYAMLKKRTALAKQAARERGEVANIDHGHDESVRTARIIALMEAHWRASTSWERKALDDEIRKLTMQG